MKWSFTLLLIIALITFSLPGFSQFTYYIGLEEVTIRKEVSNRNIQNLITDYSMDGQKVLAWKDLELKTAIIVLFDGYGKGKSCTLIPFTAKDIYEFKEVFNKNHKIIDATTWLNTIENKTFKISFQYLKAFSKYGFVITDYDQELTNKKLDELIKKLKPSADRLPNY
ncbi:hypothetical protein [Chitinophaga sp. GbtcB8]|uniref:hypothetical protein n=1 Tax=Chitinophaga sp. GbtcB8 TaxID=2824753 RepID=UPI001C2F78B3|nr:hypothetical protein [Chitinophaga sp. GbtcB8]